MYIYTYLTACRLYMLPNNAAVKHFYTNRERCEVLTAYLSLSAGPTVTGPIRDIGQNVLQILAKQETVATPVTATYSSSSHFSRRPLLEIL
jgi:hypothetical protein